MQQQNYTYRPPPGTPWYIPGYEQPALRDDTPVSLLDISDDNITWNNNKDIYQFFKTQCCDSIESFIEGGVGENYLLFVNDKETHYFLTERDTELDRLGDYRNENKVKPLTRYTNTNDNYDYFSIVHEDIFYFFKIIERSHSKYHEIHNYKDNRSITSVPVLFHFDFRTLKNEIIRCLYSAGREWYMFRKINDNLYEKVHAEVVASGNFFQCNIR